MRKSYDRHDQRGFSLVEVMVVASIISIVAAFGLSMLTSQQKEGKALTEKLASLDVTRVLTSVLSNSAQCSAIFTPSNLVSSSAMPFNSNSLATANYKFALQQIPGTGITSGGTISPLSPSLKLASGTATPPGIVIAVTSPKTVTLQLNFDQTGLVRSLNSLSFPNIPIITSGPASATTIIGCGSQTNQPGSSIWTNTGSWAVNGLELFDVSFTPKMDNTWVKLRVDIPTVGGQGGMATLNLAVNGIVVAQSFMQFANLAGHSGPMGVTYWFQPGSTAPIQIKVSMYGNGAVNQAPISVGVNAAVVLEATETLVH